MLDFIAMQMSTGNREKGYCRLNQLMEQNSLNKVTNVAGQKIAGSIT